MTHPVDVSDRHPLRTFVLDTSVLLSDPGALARFAGHEVVLPLVVISELEGKRHHPELGWFARQTLRMLDELRITHGRLDAPVPIGDHVEVHDEIRRRHTWVLRHETIDGGRGTT